MSKIDKSVVIKRINVGQFVNEAEKAEIMLPKKVLVLYGENTQSFHQKCLQAVFSIQFGIGLPTL